MDTSTVLEKTMVTTKVDPDGAKYINQYMLLDKLGKYFKLFDK